MDKVSAAVLGFEIPKQAVNIKQHPTVSRQLKKGRSSQRWRNTNNRLITFEDHLFHC
jgi:hypothetical protein